MAVPIITYTTAGYVRLTHNLYQSLCSVSSGVEPLNFTAVCCDDATLQELRALNIPAMCVTPTCQLGLTSDYTMHEWGSHGFRLTAFVKLTALSAYLEAKAQQGAHSPVLYLDGDIVAFADLQAMVQPYLDMADTDAWDLVCQCDEGHTEPCQGCQELCTGVMLLQNTSKVRDVLQFHKHMDLNAIHKYTNNDQTYLNAMYRIGALKALTFPRTICPNGMFIKQMCIPKEAMLLHFNWMIGMQKIETMQQLGMWHEELKAPAEKSQGVLLQAAAADSHGEH